MGGGSAANPGSYPTGISSAAAALAWARSRISSRTGSISGVCAHVVGVLVRAEFQKLLREKGAGPMPAESAGVFMEGHAERIPWAGDEIKFRLRQMVEDAPEDFGLHATAGNGSGLSISPASTIAIPW